MKTQPPEIRYLKSTLPLPVSVLLRRAHDAKSPKDRHDTAYFAWEVSVRLAVAAGPPQDLAHLARGSVGTWVGAPPLVEAQCSTRPGGSWMHASSRQTG